MEVWKARQTNLIRLIKQHGTAKKLAEILETDANYISQLKTEHRVKKLGHAFARRIELKTGMKVGEMDANVNLTRTGFDHHLLASIQEAVADLRTMEALVIKEPFNIESIAKLIAAKINK
ncbi:hypothetical protein EYR97_15425 [Alteromonas sp. KUL42]|uniref:hypothetical protein n=1 Tax=Alteromonas sp. KUL42 TaxID=2480797 RepID=UPI001036CD53|nr:hypothetical protein [Alteromonas sp. KUL42]TAP33292.1 hypothetical protein EYR97_15425 [Alteromonas sp. KUL42]